MQTVSTQDSLQEMSNLFFFLNKQKISICMASRFTIYSINQISDLIYQISYIIYKISDILY